MEEVQRVDLFTPDELQRGSSDCVRRHAAPRISALSSEHTMISRGEMIHDSLVTLLQKG